MRFAALPLVTALITFAAADTARGQSAGGPVMEIVTFRLRAGVTAADFLSAAKATEAVLTAQPGFVRRSLMQDENGQWTDMVEWQNLALAYVAAETVVADPAFAPFGAAIDMTGLTMRHVPILWQMGD